MAGGALAAAVVVLSAPTHQIRQSDLQAAGRASSRTPTSRTPIQARGELQRDPELWSELRQQRRSGKQGLRTMLVAANETADSGLAHDSKLMGNAANHTSSKVGTFVMVHVSDEGTHATGDLLSSLQCINVEMDECFDGWRITDASLQKSALNAFLGADRAELGVRLSEAYPDDDVAANKSHHPTCSKDDLQRRLEAFDSCRCEMRGTMARLYGPKLCQLSPKPAAALLLMRSDIMRYAISMLYSNEIGHAQFFSSEKAEEVPSRIYANITRLDEMAWQAVKRWTYMANTRRKLEGCGIKTVPLFYEMLEDDAKEYRRFLRASMQEIARSHVGCMASDSHFETRPISVTVHKAHSHVIAETVNNSAEVLQHFIRNDYPSFAETFNKQEGTAEQQESSSMPINAHEDGNSSTPMEAGLSLSLEYITRVGLQDLAVRNEKIASYRVTL